MLEVLATSVAGIASDVAEHRKETAGHRKETAEHRKETAEHRKENLAGFEHVERRRTNIETRVESLEDDRILLRALDRRVTALEER